MSADGRAVRAGGRDHGRARRARRQVDQPPGGDGGVVCATGRSRCTGSAPRPTRCRRSPPMGSLGVKIERPDDDDLVVHGVGLRGLQAPAGRIDVENAGTLMRLLPGILAGQVGSSSCSTGDASIRSPSDGAGSPEPLRQMGVAIETTDGRPPVRMRVSRPDRAGHLRLPGGVRPGQVVRPLRRPLHRAGGRRSSRSRCRPATTPSACCVTRACRSTAVRAGSRSRPCAARLDEVRGARRLLVGGALRRGGDDRRGIEPDAARRRHQPDPYRPAHGHGADGGAGRALRPPPGRRRAGGRHRGAPGRAGRHRGRARAGAGCSSTSCRWWRCWPASRTA